MALGKLLQKPGRLIGIDIGASGIKLAEVDRSGDRPKVITAGYAPISGEVFQSNVIVKQEPVIDALKGLIEGNGISGARVVTAVPGPSVFVKRARLPKVELRELDHYIRLEAANLIPHNIEAVKLDYHIFGLTDRGEIDLLLVAVKNEILESFAEVIEACGLTPAVMDVEFFALQNSFETLYADAVEGTAALIEMGHRYSAVNICREGDSLFAGDISMGAKAFIDALCETLGCRAEKAIDYLRGRAEDQDAATEVLARVGKEVATEFNRQLSFFWNAAGAEGGIDQLVLSGGGSAVPGFAELLKERTGIAVHLFDVMSGIEVGESVDPEFLGEIAPLLPVVVGLAMREPGDKEIPEFEDD